MALGSQSGRQIGQGRFMYRKRKGRPGRWLAVILIICGLGGIFWMTRTGPSSLQADGEEPTILTLDGGTTTKASGEQRSTQASGNIQPAPKADVAAFEQPIQIINEGSFAQNETTLERGNLQDELAPEIVSDIETISPAMDSMSSPNATSGNPRISEYTSLASTDPIAARSGLTSLIASGSLGARDLSSARAELNELGRILFFDPSSLPNDPFVARYTVSSGDSLSRIAQRGQISADWRIIQRLNNLKNPNAIRIGQSLKVPAGTYHAIVHKSDYTMDLYLENETGKVIIASYPVGLGAYDGTPTGRFVVRTNSRLVNPQWTNPRTGEFFYADDPENPIGERWIGLKGIDPENEELLGYGIHGTIDPESIGDMRSMGCIRLRDEDVQIVYEALTEQGSQITILP
jgi:LysM repeat protein